MARGLALWSVCALALLAGRAGAQGPKAPALNWVRTGDADGCIAAFELAERVEARLGRVVFVPPTEAELFVDGYVAAQEAPRGPGYDVVLRVSDREGRTLGERTLEVAGTDCRAIDEAVVLVIAVTLYPDTGLVGAGIPLEPETAAGLQALFGAEPTDPDPESLHASGAPAAVEAPTDVARAEPRKPPNVARPPVPVGFGVDAAVLGGLGQLPGLAAGVSGYLHLAVASWAFELGVGVWPAVEASADAGRAELSLLHGTLAVCPWQLAAGEAHLCAGLDVGRLSVTPRAFAVTAEASQDLTASVSVALVYRPVLIGPLRARAAAAALLPLVQRGYSYQTLEGGSERLFRTSQLALRVELGLGMQF